MRAYAAREQKASEDIRQGLLAANGMKCAERTESESGFMDLKLRDAKRSLRTVNGKVYLRWQGYWSDVAR